MEDAIEFAASFSTPDGPLGAVLLLGLISDYAERLDNLVTNSITTPLSPVIPKGNATADEAERFRDAINRMAFAAVRWIEQQHGVDRAGGAGTIYLTYRADPPDPRTTVPDAA